MGFFLDHEKKQVITIVIIITFCDYNHYCMEDHAFFQALQGIQGGMVIPEGWGNRSAEIKTCHVNIVRIHGPGEVRN